MSNKKTKKIAITQQ